MKILALVIWFLLPAAVFAGDRLCDRIKSIKCPDYFSSSKRSSTASYPTSSSSFNVNPSSLPTSKGVGVETLLYQGKYEFGLVSGTGRVGAGISTSNTEDTFFGNKAIEERPVYELRRLAKDKFESPNYTFASSFLVIGKSEDKSQHSGKLRVQLGILAKYNSELKNLRGGGGVNLSWGIVNAGTAAYKDQENDSVVVMMAGVKLSNLFVDYSLIQNQKDDKSKITIFSGTMFINIFMLTYGMRTEYSSRPRFVQDEIVFISDWKKEGWFYGAQVSLGKNVTLGLFLNYYLVNDATLSLQIYF